MNSSSGPPPPPPPPPMAGITDTASSKPKLSMAEQLALKAQKRAERGIGFTDLKKLMVKYKHQQILRQLRAHLHHLLNHQVVVFPCKINSR